MAVPIAMRAVRGAGSGARVIASCPKMFEYETELRPTSSARRARARSSSSVAGRRSRFPPSRRPTRISPDPVCASGALTSGRAGSASRRRISTPPPSKKCTHHVVLALLERDEASDVDELAILRRLEVRGLHAGVIPRAVAETGYQRAGEVAHLIEVRHETLTGEFLKIGRAHV